MSSKKATSKSSKKVVKKTSKKVSKKASNKKPKKGKRPSKSVQTRKAYHFTSNILRDGRPLPKVNQELRHDGLVKICKSGLHASEKLIDALYYAPGNLLHVVECKEIVEEEHDKFVCRSRTILETYPITEKQCIQFAIEAACLAFWFIGEYSQELVDALNACQKENWSEVDRLCGRAAGAADSTGAAEAGVVARAAIAAGDAAGAARCAAAATRAAAAFFAGTAALCAVSVRGARAGETLEARAHTIFLQITDLESTMVG